MNATQRAYARAKARHDAVRAHFEATALAAGLVVREEMSEEEWLDVSEKRDELEISSGLVAAAQELYNAELAMVRWSLDVSMKVATPAQRAEFGDLGAFVSKMRFRADLWKRAVDSAFRLDPRKR